MSRGPSGRHKRTPPRAPSLPVGYEPRVPLARGFSGYVTNPADEGSYDVAPAIAMNGPGSGSGKRRVPSLRRDSLGSPLVSAVRVSLRVTRAAVAASCRGCTVA